MMARTKQKNEALALQIGEAIRVRRKAAGMTQAVLAEMVGLETETISRMENGQRLPTLEKLVEIADAFHAPVAVFFEQVDTVAKQSASELYAEQITFALDRLPAAGKTFVLEVAQNYARYHVDPPAPKFPAKKKAQA
jgi:transcriptional regulator with XRE-family HTH domain